MNAATPQEAGGLHGVWNRLREFWNLVLLGLRALRPVLAIALVWLVLLAVFSRQPWPFSIEAQTEHATVLLAPQVKQEWRIDDAVLCLQSAGLPEQVVAALNAFEGDSPCPGRRWRAFDMRGLDESELRLPAMLASEGAYSAQFAVERGGRLAVQISAEGGNPLPLMLQPQVQTPALEIGHEAILHFAAADGDDAPIRLVFPFTGTGSIGKDVVWSDPTLLRAGTVSLYTRSDEAAGGRQLVTATDLLLGDRVVLGQGSGAGSSMTKGFVHYDVLSGSHQPSAMTVVALGEAESVQIVRYGDQGYDFAPGFLARLTRHSAVSNWAVLIVSLLGLMSIYQGGADLGKGAFCERLNAFCPRCARIIAFCARFRRPRGATERDEV